MFVFFALFIFANVVVTQSFLDRWLSLSWGICMLCLVVFMFLAGLFDWFIACPHSSVWLASGEWKWEQISWTHPPSEGTDPFAQKVKFAQVCYKSVALAHWASCCAICGGCGSNVELLRSSRRVSPHAGVQNLRAPTELAARRGPTRASSATQLWMLTYVDKPNIFLILHSCRRTIYNTFSSVCIYYSLLWLSCTMIYYDILSYNIVYSTRLCHHILLSAFKILSYTVLSYYYHILSYAIRYCQILSYNII
jgi:hypothetical protein